ncbi:Mitotic spindle assembly checkpoint protein MAD1 [Hondaea fermentalgiana]|uniref:Mitotic spindle assembly checkpoint protein MAD1 n=1 Tax=Hondaea fermentalgiana TaxID=2315210 RepID=A0A2R5GUX1_9STRA|nr:Mitotic spindle assembly checkpoint protein MAD1 [Hondaea fermentalgiana]|eukprot:GBG33568.1 Mitotic spindle assembly checkpoint protein MAD1 [Hondaea fermentalgiana]
MASGRKSGFTFGEERLESRPRTESGGGGGGGWNSMASTSGFLDELAPATPAQPTGARWTSGTSAPFTGGVTPIVGDRSAFMEGDYFGLRDAKGLNESSDFLGGGGGSGAPLFSVPESAGKKRPRSSEEPDKDTSRLTLAHTQTTQNQQQNSRDVVKLRSQLSTLRRQLETEQLRAKQEHIRAERDLRKEKTRTEQEARRARDLDEEIARLRREKQRLEMEAVRTRQSNDAAMDRARRQVRDLEHAKHAEMQTLEDEIKDLTEEVRTLREALEIKIEERDEAKDAEDDSTAGDSREAALRAARASAQEVQRLQIALQGAQTSLKDARAQVEDQRVEIRALHEGSAVSGRVGELNSALHRAEERESRLRNQLTELQKRFESREDDSLMVEALRAQIRKLEAQRDDLTQMEAEYNALKAERREWSGLFGELLEAHGDVAPTEVMGVVRELQAEQRKIVRQLSAAQIQASKMTAARDTAADSVLGLERELAKTQRDLTAATERAEALERQTVFLESERKSLLRVIDTVSDEPYATLSKKQQAELAEDREARRADLEGLKANLAAAHERIRELESAARSDRVQGMSPAIARQRNKQLESTEARVEALQKENRSLEKRLDEALDRVAELEHDEAAGVINPSKTKVLHLTFNPERRALGASSDASAGAKDESAIVEVLRSEIADLKAQLKEAGGGDGGRGVGDPIKRHERLKKKFMEWTRTFKEAVYLLTGLKIDMMENDAQAGSGIKILRAKSMFAERGSDELRFRWNTESDALELLETEFARRIDEDVFAYLSNFKSVPAFLASLQSDLFSRQTVQT